jgi:hypothetical protein
VILGLPWWLIFVPIAISAFAGRTGATTGAATTGASGSGTATADRIG